MSTEPSRAVILVTGIIMAIFFLFEARYKVTGIIMALLIAYWTIREFKGA